MRPYVFEGDEMICRVDFFFDVIIYFCCRGEYSLFLCLMVHRRHHVRTPYRLA